MLDIRTQGDWAEIYAARCWPIFPANERTKEPLVSQYDATCDVETARTWWDRWPSALIGYLPAEDELLIDVDPRHGGLSTWNALKAEFGDPPPTRKHVSGRGDGGGHVWFRRPDGLVVSASGLDAWARDNGTGEEKGNRWISGIDILQHHHRYSILPPSLHPVSRRPYEWISEDEDVAPMPDWLVDLLRKPEPAVSNGKVIVFGDADSCHEPDPDSIADWFCSHRGWNAILEPHGWSVASGDGNEEGSLWLHPDSTSGATHSASIRFGMLFVHSNATVFEQTSPGDPHGYTRFKAWTRLEHDDDGSAAASAARRMKDPEDPDDGVLLMNAIAARGESRNPALELVVPEVGLIGRPDPLDRLRPRDLRQVLEEARMWRPEYLVKHLWMRGSYGQLAAWVKSGKSYVGTAITVGVASGQPVFDTFDVPKPGPVLVYIGEGGQYPFADRLMRMARAHGIADLDDLPIHIVPATAPVTSPGFQYTLRENLERYEPVLVWLDPLYAYSDPTADSKVLSDIGRMLNSVSEPCVEAGAALIVNNHFNKTGSGSGLARITGAGHAEHCDSWLLLEQRADYEKATGTFHLRVQAGSRQGTSSDWDIDLTIGPFDAESVCHLSDPTWTVQPADGTPIGRIGNKERYQEARKRILEVVSDKNGELSRTDVKAAVPGNRQTVTMAFDDLVDDHYIEVKMVPGKTNKTSRVLIGETYRLMAGEAG